MAPLATADNTWPKMTESLRGKCWLISILFVFHFLSSQFSFFWRIFPSISHWKFTITYGLIHEMWIWWHHTHMCRTLHVIKRKKNANKIMKHLNGCYVKHLSFSSSVYCLSFSFRHNLHLTVFIEASSEQIAQSEWVIGVARYCIHVIWVQLFC